MSSRLRLWACLALVAGLYVFHVHLKTAKIFAHPTWDARDEVGQFWSEAAFHYRFAKFFAEHPLRDWGELARDRDVQRPDTINDWAEFTVAMEVPVGVLYRLGGRCGAPLPPFHVFLVWYDCLVSSLSLFALFFLARALWRSDAAGVCASVFYAALYPSYGRTVKNLFLREDFAIPLILLAIFLTIRALQRAETGEKNVGSQIGAALAWLAALASWHLTPFLFAVGVGAAVLVYLGQGETPRVPWFVVMLALGAVTVPVLRAKQFFISPAMVILYALSLAVWINGGRKRALKIFAATAGGLLVVTWLLQQSYGEYAHVYQLFFYKLRFLGVKPADPARLPWEARSLWEGAFNTAAWTEWWHSLLWCGPLAIAVVATRGRMKAETAVRVFVVFTLLLVPLAWMVVRYFTFLGFAVAVVAAGVATRGRWWKPAAVAAAVWQLVSLNFGPLERVQPAPAEYRPVVAWLRANTATNAVVLATVTESPVLWAHTGRPEILHPKFENWTIRDRYREFLDAIYGSEDQFFDFARRYGADFFVYDSSFLFVAQDSRRYKANRLAELPANCAARLFAEAPGELRRFELMPVDEPSGRFRVFRVRR